LFILWSFLILCFTIITAHEKAKKDHEADFMRDIVSSGRGHYEKMNEQVNALRILKHDYKFHLNTAIDMLQRGEIEKSGEYLSGLKLELTENEVPNFCDNPVINSLVADYAQRCAALDTKLDVSISIPDDFSFPNYEMCIVLGNLLENAVEACQKITNQRFGRKIELVVKPKGKQLAIMVRNTFDGNVVKDGEQLASTKKDGGLGLQSIRAVVQRYGDVFYTEYDDNWFSAFVFWTGEEQLTNNNEK
jgi:sensor histidine kinase regulating citrate/malate metabolism